MSNMFFTFCYYNSSIRYNLTSKDVKNEARFQDSVGVFPEFIDGYNILILPTTGRYFQVCVTANNFPHLGTTQLMSADCRLK